MNEELTREVLEALGSCMNTCGDDCKARGVCLPGQSYVRRKLATALLEERAKPKDDVWKYASDGTTTADVYYGNSVLVSATPDHTFRREIPKPRARQIAEEVTALVNRAIDGISVKEIEAVLNKYAEELEGKE